VSGGPARRRMPAGGQAEGDDKAFWISFADLMTALMVLFLVVMAVTLLTITRPQTSPVPPTLAPANPAVESPPLPPAPPAEVATNPPKSTTEAEEVEKLMRMVAAAVDASPGVRLDARRHVIDFGDRARFQTGSHKLDDDSARLLRSFVPQLLAISQSELGLRWVRRVVVEGFSDPRGSYLYNLNLSLQRAERVLCVLLDAPPDGTELTEEQRAQVRSIFSVGGFSFNDQRASLDASRRIEMRVEFGPPPVTPTLPPGDDAGACRLRG
jgi:outer membrane protein OmpA-like peptidoglycan-associated protein